MADNSAQDRNLPASQRKLQRVRAEGQIARSRDLSHFATIAAGGAALVAFGPGAARTLQEVLASALRFDAAALATPAAMGERMAALAPLFLAFVAPLGALMMVVALAVALAGGGWVWSFKPLAPRFSKLNPLAGLPRLMSKRQLGDTLKACLLALLLGGIGAWYLSRHIDSFGAALALPLPTALGHVASTLAGGVALLVLLLAAFALVDVPLQRHLHLARQKMSHQEAKQEHKELEGNAEVKSKVKALMRERANRRMIAAVPKADLVVMNPTHYAVALKYDDATMAAPRVVAKGADLLAMRIRDAANEHKVPVLQAPPLARALYAHAQIDREIPAALFAAVAQVLAYVYQLRAALGGKAPMPQSLPALAVPAELDPHHTKGDDAPEDDA